jgi:hypothetical protein
LKAYANSFGVKYGNALKLKKMAGLASYKMG